ncbi:helix-turn-helix domain-containing protein [bacterium]|nr:helix-turn-helix domain-containing protein [bacterium]
MNNSGNYEKEFVAISKHLINVRNDNDISQKELAILTGVSKSFICNIEKGNKKLSLNMALKISKALNIKLSHLFEYEYLLFKD